MPLVVVGDGPLRGEVPGALGFLPHEELERRYERAAVVACPSHREGFGVVCAEAMAHGRPVVAGDVGGLRDLVVHEETGLLVPPGDVGALRDALERLLGGRRSAAALRRGRTCADRRALHVGALCRRDSAGLRGRAPLGSKPHARCEDRLLGIARTARLDPCRLPARGCAGGPRAAPSRGELGDRADRERDRRGPQRGRRDRAPRAEPARARLSGRPARGRRRLRRFDRRARTRSSSASPAEDRAFGSSAARAPARSSAQNRGVAESSGEIVAFSDANARLAARRAARARPQLRRSGRRLRHRPRLLRGGRRHEPGGRLLALRALAPRAGVARSARSRRATVRSTRVRRADWFDQEPWCGHDLGLPVPDGAARAARRVRPRRGLDREAVAGHRGRVPAQGADARAAPGCTSSAGCCGGVGPVYFVELVSHRLLRYGSGILHVAAARARTRHSSARAGSISSRSRLQLAWLLLAAAGRLRLPIPGAGLAYYYLVVTWATVDGLARYVRFGPPLLWERIEGTR